MKIKIAQFLILCILFTVVLPINVWAADSMTFTMDDNYVNGNIYTTVRVMANQGNYISWGHCGNVQASSDGINWTSGSNTWGNRTVRDNVYGDTLAGDLYGVVYNDAEKKYVGIGNNCYASSLDGKTWQSEVCIQNLNNNDLLYANGKYYTVNNGNGGSIRQSTDGKSWRALTTGLSGSQYYFLNGITYGQGKYIVVGYGGLVLNSSDGESWSNQTLDLGNNYISLNDVIYAGGQYVIAGSYGTILTSSNGNVWVKQSTGLSNYSDNLSSISYGNGKYVVVGGGKILSSSDGINWSVTNNSAENYNQVCFDSSGFVATGGVKIAHSINGVSWTEKDMFPKQTISYISDLQFLNGKYVAVGKGFMSSTDGVAWTRKNETEDLVKVSYGNGKYVGIGSGKNYSLVVKTSNDGVTWQPQTVNVTGYLAPRDISCGNDKFVLVGYGGMILYSSDGANWTQATSGVTSSLLSVVYTNGRFIAAGDLGTILSSTDGIHWSPAKSGLSNTDYTSRLTDLTVGNGLVIGVSLSGAILSSSDGITWTKHQSGTTHALMGVSYGDGHFVVIGAGGTVLSSTDGATWKAESLLAQGALGMIASNGSGFLIGMSPNYNDRIFRGTSSIDSRKDITGFTVPEQVGTSDIDSTNHTISFHMAIGSSVKSLAPTITVSAGATINPKSKVAKDFTDPVIYTVTAQDGTSQIWTVTCIVDQKSSAKDITEFTVPKQVGSSDIDSTNHTISFHMKNGTSVKRIAPTITVSVGATINPKSKVAKDFTDPVIYTVTGPDGTIQTWTVTCVVDPKSNAKDITAFTVPKQVGSSDIDSTNHTINFHMAIGTSVKSLAPTITVSAEATINPKSKAAKNFTDPVIYTVTAPDGTSQTWTVTCVVDPKSSAKDIAGFKVSKQVGNSTIDATNHTIIFHMKNGTSVNKISPTITVSEFATISPKSKAAKNFTDPVIYTVTAQDGTSQPWTVTCIIDPKS